jgi:hypothetical protein
VHYTALLYSENMKKNNHTEDVDIEGRIMFQHLNEIVCGDGHWTNLAQDGVQWQVLSHR